MDRNSPTDKFNVNLESSFFKKNKYQGFTLSEVLITLAIIGIVATITIPILFSNRKSADIARVKVEYAKVQNLFESLQADLGSYESWPKMDNDFYKQYVTPKLKFSKVKYNYEDSFYTTENAINACVSGYCTWAVEYELDDGAMWSFASSYETDLANIIIDINGTRGPNLRGVDIFHVHFNKNPDNKTYSSFPYGLVARGQEAPIETLLNNCRINSGANYAAIWADYLAGDYQTSGFYNDNNMAVSCLGLLVRTNFDTGAYPITQTAEK